MEISICIVSWNVRRLLLKCLESVRRELAETTGEAFVVDNASRDGSAAAAAAAYPEFQHLPNDSNRGFAAACNQAMRRARGRYILLLNPDAVLSPGCLAGMVAFLDRFPQAGGGGCRQLNPNGSLQPSVRTFPNLLSGLDQFTVLGRLGILRPWRRKYLAAGFDYSRAGRVEQPMGAALFLRRQAVENTGWMDEGYFLYFEEVDLCWRLAQAGHPMYYNPAVFVTHYGGASTEQAGAKAGAWLLYGYFRFLTTRYGPETALRWRRRFAPLIRARLTLDLLTAKSQARRELKREFRDRYLERILAGEYDPVAESR